MSASVSLLQPTVSMPAFELNTLILQQCYFIPEKESYPFLFYCYSPLVVHYGINMVNI